MKVFKKTQVVLLALVMLFSLAFGLACNNSNTTSNNGYTVTFMVEGEQYGEKLTVQKGRRITQPEDPTFSTEGYVFTGWYTDATFAENTLWNFQTGIVNSDMTLYAGYKAIEQYVTELAKADEPCTSKLVWTQNLASDASAYEITITDKYGATQSLTGTVAFDEVNFKVTFTPDPVPQGGYYTVSVKDTTKSADANVVENVLFGGEGSESNPYLIGSALDFTMVNQADVEEGTYFSLANNITIETSRELQRGYEFNGTLLGNGRTITLENSNSAAIYKLGEKGYIYNVNVAGVVSTSLFDSVGSIVDFNAGKVEKVSTTANVESSAGLTGANGLANALNTELADGAGNRGIAGGIVGTNLSTGIIYNCKISTSSSSTGTIKASIGGGTIVGLNYGKVEMCVSNGCFGAWNSTESGKSLSNYSYGGGIAGINAGIVTKCSVTGSAKLLAQRYLDSTQVTAGTNNSNFGGIVGYNMQNATVSECYFSGIRVHADENVGGIAGLNAGVITDSYVEGAYSSSTSILAYIGGRINVGGIVGKMEDTGSVTNCFTTANVFSFTEGTAWAAAEKTTNTVYLSANPNAKSLSTNPDAVTLTAPTGNGNEAVTVEANSYDGQNINFVLEEKYLATINGNNKFNYNGTTIKLNFETEVLPEVTMEVTLYSDNEVFGVATVAETPSIIAGPTKSGFKFVGWATEADGEVVIATGNSVSLYDLQDYLDADGKVSLYAIFEIREANEGLIVAIWNRYVNTEALGLTTSDTIKEQYLAYMQEKGLSYEVEFRIYSQSAVADFGAAVNADGDIDVILGAGSNIQTSGGVAYILRSSMVYEGLTSRLAVLLTDTDRAVEFYAWAAGLNNEDVEITFNVGGEQISGTVNALWNTTVTAPEVTVEAGYVFKGWATTENATEALINVTVLGYDDVEEYVVDGKVNLYPVAVAAKYSAVVSVWAKSESWVTNAELENIKTGFNDYLVNKDYDVNEVFINWVITNTSGVADLGAEVNTAGNVDIIVGCGNNVDSATGANIDIIAKGDILTSYVGANRKVAFLTENEIAKLMYSYLTGIEYAEAEITFAIDEEVTETINSFYGTVTVPTVTVVDGYEFKGWATTEDATEATVTGTSVNYAAVESLLVEGKVTLYPVLVKVENSNEGNDDVSTYTLKVSVWTKGGDWITATELENIKTGFNTYLTTNGYDLDSVEIEWVETTLSKVADLGAEVNAAGDFDIVVGCGNNINTTAGVSISEKANIVTTYVAAERMCARLTDNEIATLLYTYLTTAQA